MGTKPKLRIRVRIQRSAALYLHIFRTWVVVGSLQAATVFNILQTVSDHNVSTG